MSGGRSVADFDQCKFQHREGNKPVERISDCVKEFGSMPILPSLHCAMLEQFHCRFPNEDCFPRFQEARIDQLLLSYAGFCRGMGAVL